MEKQNKQIKVYNRRAKDLRPLDEGEIVRMKPHILGQKVWRRARVDKRLDERSYEITAENGNSYRT